MEFGEFRSDVINAAVAPPAPQAPEAGGPSGRGNQSWIPNWGSGPGAHAVDVASVVRDTRWRAIGQKGAQHLARVVVCGTAAYHGWHQEIRTSSARVLEIAPEF